MHAFFVLLLLQTKKSFNRDWSFHKQNFYKVYDASTHGDKYTVSHTKFVKHAITNFTGGSNTGKFLLKYVLTVQQAFVDSQSLLFNYPGLFNLGLFLPQYIIRFNNLTRFFKSISPVILPHVDNLIKIRLLLWNLVKRWNYVFFLFWQKSFLVFLFFRFKFGI